MGSTGADGVVGVRGAGLAIARGDAVAPRPGSGDADADLVADIEVATNPVRPLRRLGVGAALDQGVDLLRFRFRRLVGLAACLFLPIQLLDVTLRVTNRSGSTSDDVPVGAVFALGGSSGWEFVPLVLQVVALSILGLGVGHMVGRLVQGHDSSFRELLRVSARRSWVAILIVPLSLAVRAPFVCLPGVGFIIGGALVFVASTAAGAEGLGPVASIGRSLRLSRGAFGPALVLSLGSVCITEIIRTSLYAGPVLLASAFAPPEGVIILIGQLASLVLLVVQPLTACIAASSYLLLRARREGIDLDHRLAERVRARGPRAEVAGAR